MQNIKSDSLLIKSAWYNLQLKLEFNSIIKVYRYESIVLLDIPT